MHALYLPRSVWVKRPRVEYALKNSYCEDFELKNSYWQLDTQRRPNIWSSPGVRYVRPGYGHHYPWSPLRATRDRSRGPQGSSRACNGSACMGFRLGSLQNVKCPPQERWRPPVSASSSMYLQLYWRQQRAPVLRRNAWYNTCIAQARAKGPEQTCNNGLTELNI